MSKQPIGPKEQALRDLRAKTDNAPKLSVKSLAAELPPTSGKKPVKRKQKRRPKP
jgi:hypothetical protein